MPANLWSNTNAPDSHKLQELAYRSNLLGQDRSVCNLYTGSTSAKTVESDHMGRAIDVLWVKGSGSDLADITEHGFAGLKLEEMLPLFERTNMTDEEMVDYLNRTTLEPGRPRQSIEALLHAFVPARHVDHTHPDAIISLACSPNGEQIMREIYGDRAVLVPYLRPGFALARQIGVAVHADPRLECVIMGNHGLVTWGETSRECYENTLRIIGEAEAYITPGVGAEPFGRRVVELLGTDKRRSLAAQVLPVIRSAIHVDQHGILAFDDASDVLEFVCAAESRTLAQAGAACPDQLAHTKHVPLWIDWQPGEGVDALIERIKSGVADFAAAYQAYFEAYRVGEDCMFPPTPRVILIPGLGMITTGADVPGSDVARRLYHGAIAVMRGARALGGFVSLTPAEAYAVEYWPLELYTRSLHPTPKSLHGRVALVTGAASGIGRAIARRFAAEGACVVIADVDAEGAEVVANELVETYGAKRGLAVHCDVTNEAAVIAAFRTMVLEYGGADIVVNNAGIASSAPIEETSLALWQRNHAILATGYFLVAREAFRLWRTQGIGGNLIIVSSKNAVAAPRNAAAYGSAKAAEVHLARCLAEEGGTAGIRVNTILPDAVLAGTRIYSSAWRNERAATYGIAPDQLEAFYRARTTLKVNVLPEDVAEAALFFASDRSSKTTGAILTVDGGVATAYVR